MTFQHQGCSFCGGGSTEVYVLYMFDTILELHISSDDLLSCFMFFISFMFVSYYTNDVILLKILVKDYISIILVLRHTKILLFKVNRVNYIVNLFQIVFQIYFLYYLIVHKLFVLLIQYYYYVPTITYFDFCFLALDE